MAKKKNEKESRIEIWARFHPVRGVIRLARGRYARGRARRACACVRAGPCVCVARVACVRVRAWRADEGNARARLDLDVHHQGGRVTDPRRCCVLEAVAK